MESAKQTYERLHQDGDKYGDDNYCSVIAIAAAANVSYEKAYAIMQAVGRKYRKGSSVVMIKTALEKVLRMEVKVDFHSERKVSINTKLFTLKRKLQNCDSVLIISGQHVSCLLNSGLVDYDKGYRKMVKFTMEVKRTNLTDMAIKSIKEAKLIEVKKATPKSMIATQQQAQKPTSKTRHAFSHCEF